MDITKFEKIVIAGMLQKKIYNRIAVRRANDEFIKDLELKNIYLILKKYYMQFGDRIRNKSVLKDILANKGYDYDRYFLIIKKIKQIKVSETDFQYALDKLKQNYLFNKTSETITDVVNELKEKGIDATEDILNEFYQKMYKLQISGKMIDRKRVNVVNTPVKDLNLYLQDEKKPISSGVKAIDNVIGGWRPGELTVLIAMTGHGKSIFLLNFGYNAYVDGRNVIFVTIEIPEVQFRRRLNSLSSGVDYSKMRRKELSLDEWKQLIKSRMLFGLDKSEHKVFENLWKKYQKNITNISSTNPKKIYKDLVLANRLKARENYFYCLDIPEGCSVSVLKSEIGQLAEDCDLLIVDYIGIMNPSVNTDKQKWETMETITKELKELCRVWDIPIITAAQMKEGDAKESKITTGRTKYSKAIAENCDIEIGWEIEDPLKDRVRLEIAKGRDVPASKIDVCKDFDVMKIRD